MSDTDGVDIDAPQIDPEDLKWLTENAGDVGGNGQATGQENSSRVSADVKLAANAVRKEQQLIDLRDTVVQRTRDDNWRRKILFRLIIAAASAPVLVSSGIMIALVWQQRETELMVTAFFASVVAQTVGLLYTIARHHFPEIGEKAELPTE